MTTFSGDPVDLPRLYGGGQFIALTTAHGSVAERTRHYQAAISYDPATEQYVAWSTAHLAGAEPAGAVVLASSPDAQVAVDAANENMEAMRQGQGYRCSVSNQITHADGTFTNEAAAFLENEAAKLQHRPELGDVAAPDAASPKRGDSVILPTPRTR